MGMVNINDFEDPKLGKIDWPAYRARQVQEGERCRDCGDHIPVDQARGRPGLCQPCIHLAQTWPTRHQHLIRCPHCRTVMPVTEEMQTLPDGEHEHLCPACLKNFTTEVCREVIFRSPGVENPKIGAPPKVGG